MESKTKVGIIPDKYNGPEFSAWRKQTPHWKVPPADGNANLRCAVDTRFGNLEFRLTESYEGEHKEVVKEAWFTMDFEAARQFKAFLNQHIMDDGKVVA